MIKSITIYHIKLPMLITYRLSFRDINFLESSIVEIETNGIITTGESTPLPGYSHESIDSVLKNQMHWARKLTGKDIEAAMKLIEHEMERCPFAATAFYTAMELSRSKKESPFGTSDFKHKDISLAGIVSSNDFNEIREQALGQQKEGFSVIKIKVGLPSRTVSQDIEKVQYVHGLIPEIALRVDANKGYNIKQAREFISHTQDCNIEEFEQPLSVGQWDEQKEIFKMRDKVPLMLDESINTMRDLDRAIGNECCDYVKFKLMKHGSFRRINQLIERALSANLQVIIGNGVQTEWACMQEAQLLARIDMPKAGENNGFLKQKISLLKNPIFFCNGMMTVDEVEMSRDTLIENSLNIYRY